MANRYAVATGVWDTTNTSIWSATDGGAPGASAPTSSDKVLLTAASGAITVTLGANVSCLECIQTGFTGTLDWAGNKITVNGVSWVGSATCTNTGTPVVEVAYAGSSSVTIAGSSLAEANAVSFNVTAATGALTVSGGVKNLNLTGFTGSLVNSARAIYGNLTASATVTYGGGGSTTTFAATSGTQVITSNGVTLDFPVTVNAPGATIQLADALTLGSTRTFTLTAGGLDLNGNNLTCQTFSSTNTNVRSITSGLGQFYCSASSSSGSTVPWTANIITGLTLVDRPTINLTGNGSGTAIRGVQCGAVGEAVAPNVNVLAGTDTVNNIASNVFGSFDFTGFSGSWQNNSRTLYGSLTLSTTMTCASGTGIITFAATSGTQVITSNGVTLDFPITVAAVGGTVQLADALTLGSTRTFTHTAGGLDLNGKNLTTGLFSSSNANVRSITSGAGQFYLTGTGVSSWNTTTTTNLTLVDRPTCNLTGAPTSGSRTVNTGTLLEAVAPNFNITAGSDTVNLTPSLGAVSLAGFSGALANGARTVYGNWTGAAGMTYNAGSNTTTFAATSGTQVITSNGVTLDFPITANCPGATLQLADALTMAASRALTLTAGTFDANNKNVTTGNFTAGAGATTRVTSMGTGTWTILDAGATAWSTPAAASHTVTPSTSTILMTAATAKTFAGGGRTFWNLSNGGAGALTITGANTFNDLQNTVTPATFTLPASTTTTVSALSLQGTSGNLVTLQSSSAGTRATLSKASGTVDVSYLSIKDSAATGGASFFAQTGNGNIDAGNNTGWSFATRTAVTGVGAAGSAGDASVTAGASTSPAGVSATGSVEAVAVSILVALVVAGLQAVGGAGTVDETAGSNVYVSGAEAFGVAGDASVTAGASTSPTGVPATGSVGTAAVALPRTVEVTGLRAVGGIGTVAATADSNVYVSGIQALGLISQTLVWGVIDTAEVANWTPVDDGNTVTWVEIPT